MKQNIKGMTLIELLTVIVVLSIITSIAVSSYRGYLLRANRSEAKMALLRIQVAQEKFFLQNNRYATNAELASTPPGGLGIPTSTPNGYYTIDLSAATNTSYTARAQAAAGQTSDKTACRTFTINEQGNKTPTDLSCWK